MTLTNRFIKITVNELINFLAVVRLILKTVLLEEFALLLVPQSILDLCHSHLDDEFRSAVIR
jgi:hypothetical protein